MCFFLGDILNGNIIFDIRGQHMVLKVKVIPTTESSSIINIAYILIIFVNEMGIPMTDVNNWVKERRPIVGRPRLSIHSMPMAEEFD